MESNRTRPGGGRPVAAARPEALHQSRLAARHAQRSVELLQLADSTERVIRP